MSKRAFPFEWLRPHFGWLSVASLLGAAAFYRLWQLPSLPPGLYSGEARLGLEALALADKGHWPALTAANSYSALWVWLEAITVKLLGPTELALRLWPALLGVAAVWFTWLWVRDWFGSRIGWLAAFLVAVTPWAVTLSRNAAPAALMLCLVPLTLWVGTQAYRHGGLRWWLSLSGVLVLNLLAGPLGWLVVAAVTILGAIRLAGLQQLRLLDTARLAGAGVLAVGLGVLGILVVVSWAAVSGLPKTAGFSFDLGGIAQAVGQTLAMFNWRGDENPRHNFGGEPMLNVFVGLMLIAGILVAVSHMARRHYRTTVILLVVLLLPAMVAGASAPNAAWAVTALPLVALVAAIGVNFMLELWYSTFPINSAARSVGQAVVIVLLGLTALQGYTHYFRAWASSGATYTAYNEPAVRAAKYVKANSFNGQRYVITTPDEQPVIGYLAAGSAYRLLQPNEMAALPAAPGGHQFVITASVRQAAEKHLATIFPGGKLRPQLSPLSHNEIFYIYEVTK